MSQKIPRLILLAASLLLATGLLAPGHAQETVRAAPGSELKQNAEKGWFWYEQPVKPADPTPPKTPPEPQPQKAEVKKDPCKEKDTWTVACGFVEPGEDFEFQAKQRDELFKMVSMRPGDAKLVEALQRYVKWVMDKATEASNVWLWNLVQHPDLDPRVSTPISEFGLKLMTDAKSSHSSEIFRLLKEEEALLIYFSRTDCRFCHVMLPTINQLAKATDLELWNASLDDSCMPGLEPRCAKKEKSVPPAQALQVAIVPTVFLYIKSNTWIRVATGVVDLETMKARMVSFFSAYRAALLKGAPSGEGEVPVDFSTPALSAATQTGLPSGKAPRMPTQQELDLLVGKKR